MPRKPPSRTLPALVELYPGFKGFPSSDSHQKLLHETLRTLAKRRQRKHPQAFYSLREISRFFGVSLRTAAIAYEQLEHEGLLRRIRGTQTLLTGKRVSPQKAVRAVVGMPIWLQTVLGSPYAWALCMEIEELLRKNGFVADFIFFRGTNNSIEDIVDRLLSHHLDYIIWYVSPRLLNPQILLSMKDRGIQQVVIHSKEKPGTYPCATYLQDWQTAYGEMASRWKQQGIQRVFIPKPSDTAQWETRCLMRVLASHELASEIIPGSLAQVRKESRRRPREKSAVAFTSMEEAHMLCNEDPFSTEELLNTSLIAFCRGPLRLPYFHHRPLVVDLVGIPPSLRARRIVDDLCSGEVRERGVLHTFYAEYHPQIDLSSHQELF